MSMTLHLDEEIQIRLLTESKRVGHSPEILAKSILLRGLGVPQIASAGFTYEEMIREYEAKLRLNAECENSVPPSAPRERFVVKPLNLGELNPRFEGLTPSEIDEILQIEEYEETIDRARHQSPGTRL